jgi:cellulose synthase/poly-beta-1,6-N-acetylglucosamine synthase-like glycosyltransferase
MLAEILFISSLSLIAYVCFGYPMLVFVMSRLRARPVRRDNITPKLSVIIAAYNEERAIARKIEDTLALDYPKEKVEIIVASDCSTDRTDEIVRQFSDRGVILRRQSQRLGKTMAQNSAAEDASGEILVFTDATTGYRPDALRKLVRSFADAEVGCVSSQLIYVDRSKTSVGRGCRSYWGYETLLRQSESRLGSMIGVAGCLYAVRRSSYTPLEPDMCSDFVIASAIRLKGLRTIHDQEAISIEDTNNRSRDEFRMRVRIVEQTMSAMSRYREVLDPRRHGLFALQMISHKLLRYSAPVLLFVALISNLFLVNDSDIYRITMAGQGAFYFAALGGALLARFGVRLGVAGLPYYFVLANVAILAAFIQFARGEAHVVWEPLRETSQSSDSIKP